MATGDCWHSFGIILSLYGKAIEFFWSECSFASALDFCDLLNGGAATADTSKSASCIG